MSIDMKVNDKRKAYEIINALPLPFVVEEGPDDPDVGTSFLAHMSLQQIAIGMQGSGVNISSLDQAEWIEVLERRFGIDSGDAFAYLEQLAEWGKTDD